MRGTSLVSLTWHLREGHSIIRTAFPKGCPHFIPTPPAIPPTHPTLVTPGVARKTPCGTKGCQEKPWRHQELPGEALVGSPCWQQDWPGKPLVSDSSQAEGLQQLLGRLIWGSGSGPLLGAQERHHFHGHHNGPPQSSL